MSDPIRDGLQQILDRYGDTPPGTPWGQQHEVYRTFSQVIALLEQAAPITKRSANLKLDFSGRGRQSTLPWIAFLDRRETSSTQDGVYCVYLFRRDLTAVYLTLAIGVEGPRRSYARDNAAYKNFIASKVADLRGSTADLAEKGFLLDGNIDLHSNQHPGPAYQAATVAYRMYEANALPDDAALLMDLETVLSAYDRYLDPNAHGPAHNPGPPASFNMGIAAEELVEGISGQQYVFEPWQIASYVTALRTKPFVILAGVTGTGKTSLPRLVAHATGSDVSIVPVRPDWTDSADVLGYSDLQGKFRPGVVLARAKRAMDHPEKFSVCVLDEMNLARVEQYLAELLSRIEDRRQDGRGGYFSEPLLAAEVESGEWSRTILSSNFAVVGTVNMDESAHGFSRKVLDRAFTIELSEIDLERWKTSESIVAPANAWPVEAWGPRAISLSVLQLDSDDEELEVRRIVSVLSSLNQYLTQAQLQVGYRTRDEVVLFVLHAQDLRSTFVTSAGDAVDPLDLAIQMKVLPRIIGGSSGVRRAMLGLLGWASGGVGLDSEEEAQPLVDHWNALGRSGSLPEAHFPRTAARLCLMWERMVAEGFTSFWL